MKTAATTVGSDSERDGERAGDGDSDMSDGGRVASPTNPSSSPSTLSELLLYAAALRATKRS
jgi:hypothetical protein